MPPQPLHYSIISAGASTVKVWDLADTTSSSSSSSPTTADSTTSPFALNPTATYPIHGQVKNACWSMDKTLMAIVTAEGIVKVFENGLLIEEIVVYYPESSSNKDSLTTVEFLSKGRLLAFAGSAGVVHIWDRKEKKYISHLEGHHATITSLTANVDNSRIASCDIHGRILLHSMKNGTRQTLECKSTQSLNQCAFHPLSRSTLAAAGDDGNIYVWDVNRSNFAETFGRHDGPIQGLCWSQANKNVVVTAGFDKTVRVWSVGEKRQVKCYTTEYAITSVSMNDKYTIGIGTSQGRIVFFDLRYKGEVASFWLAHDTAVSCILFQPVKWSLPTATNTAAPTPAPSSQQQPTSAVSQPPSAYPPSQTPRLPSSASNLGSGSGSGANSVMDVFSPVVMSKSASTGFGNTTTITTNNNNTKKPSPIQTQPPASEMLQRSASIHGPSPLSSVPPVSAINLDALSASQIDSVPPSAKIAPTKTDKILRNIDEAVASVKETIVSGVMAASSSTSIGGMVSAATNGVDSMSLKDTSQKQSGVSLLEKSDSAKETFQYQLISNVVEDSLEGFREQVRRDIRDMHVEVLRQFWIQKNELEQLFLKYSPTTALMEENERLREENTRLRHRF